MIETFSSFYAQNPLSFLFGLCVVVSAAMQAIFGHRPRNHIEGDFPRGLR